MRTPSLFAFVAVAVASSACAPSPADDDPSTSEHAAVSDIGKMTARGDGTFDVECRDGRKEVVSADDVTAGRVCKPAVMPASPFAAGACTGSPMTEAEALARLDGAPGPVRVGSFVLALRHRSSHYVWNDQRGWGLSHYTWDDAPNDALVAYRDTALSSTSGIKAVFVGRGAVEIARDDSGAPFVRLVSEAANEIGPDTTRFMRFVSEPMRPWKDLTSGPRLALEQARGANASWTAVTEYGFRVEMRERTATNHARSWWFEGSDVTAIVTDRCGQLVSAQSMSTMSPVDGAIAIYMLLD